MKPECFGTDDVGHRDGCHTCTSGNECFKSNSLQHGFDADAIAATLPCFGTEKGNVKEACDACQVWAHCELKKR